MNYRHKYLKYKQKYVNLKNGLYETTTETQNVQDNITDANNFFTIAMFDDLEGASNLFSPICVSILISLMQLAAINKTDQQLTKILQYKYSLDELEYMHKNFNNDVIKMSNILIVNDEFAINKEYRKMIKKLALVSAVIIQKVNRYIEKKTDGLIKNIISTNDPSPGIVLVGTTYFKASFQHKFNVTDTTKMKFHRTESNLIDIMHQINYFSYYENKSVQMIELPYDEKDYVMGIILPRKYLEEEGLDYSVNNVPKFTVQEINEFINNTQYIKVDLYLPKFVQKKNIDLIPILKKMGVDDKLLHFDLISKNILVEKIIHESAIIVDETGTESPTIIKEQLSDDILPKLFKATHAFVYYVRHIPSNLFLLYGDYQGN